MELQAKHRKAKLEAKIHLKNLLHNYEAIRACAGGARICCVVKADAYGHGAWECARYLSAHGADFFAVSSVAEAEEIRDAVGEPERIGILILGYTLPADADILYRCHISQAVFSGEYADALRDAVREYKLEGILPPDARLSVHIKLDTGMNRIGFSPDDTENIARVCRCRDFSPDGIFSHFALSDSPDSPMTEEQYRRFLSGVSALEAEGIHFPLRHICNSAAITNYPREIPSDLPDPRLDMVRYGVELYGLMPSRETVPPPGGLLPVMTLRTLISHIHTVPKGASIGYGAAYVADRERRIATLPVGYADGFVRAYHGASVTVCGKQAPVVGRICMDQCMVDITDIPEAKLYDPVTVFGEGGQSADELAALGGTIGYEVLCLIGKRVPRVYTG